MNAGISIDRLKASLVMEEGRVLNPYKCPAGKKTIGVGHNIDAKGLPDFIEFYLSQHGEITDEMSDYLLDLDVQDAVEATVKLFSQAAWGWLTQKRREVLVEMTFNMGSLNEWHHLIASVEQHDLDGCIQSMQTSLWHRQLPERSNRLIEKFRKG